jgi:basic membrane protein A
MRQAHWRTGFVLVLLVLGLLVFAACGGDDEGDDGAAAAEGSDGEAAGGEPIKTAVLLFGRADDQSWNTSMVDSVERLTDEAGLEVLNVVESVVAADASRALREVVEQGGAELVIAHGSAFDQATKEVAPEFPDVCFIQAYGQGEPPANMTYYYDDSTGATYLAGMAAGAVSESGVIGTVGGVDLPEIVNAAKAFENGAKAINPNIEHLVTWVGDFEDPLKGKEAGLAQIQQGADVLFALGDGTGLGTVEGAKEQNVKVIGAWFDQYELAPEIVVTSWQEDWAPMIRDVVAKYRSEGAGACGIGAWVGDLANGGAILAPFHDYEDDIPDDVKQQIEEARAAILDGSLDPVTGATS